MCHKLTLLEKNSIIKMSKKPDTEADLLRIQELAIQIDALSSEMRTLVLKVNKKEISKPQPTIKGKTIVIGSKVVITNRYKGNYGKTGVVIAMNKIYVDIKLDSEDLVVKKAKTSVKLI